MTEAKTLKKLGTDTLVYGLGGVMQVFVNFLLFPLYTRVLSQAEFGAQDLIYTFLIVSGYLLVMGLDSAAARYYFDTTVEKEKRLYLSSWLWLEALVSVPIAIVLIVYAEPFCSVVFGNAGLASPFRLAVASVPFYLIMVITNITLRLTFRPRAFSLLTVLGLLSQGVAAILLVAVFGMGLTGVFLAVLLSYLVQASIGLVLIAPQLLPSFSLKHLAPMLKFGMPLVPASLSLWILNYSNRYFITTGLADVGLFGAAFRINAVLALTIIAFQNAWPPFAFSLLADPEQAKRTYARVLTYFVLFGAFAWAGLSIFAREALIVVATSNYAIAYTFVPLILLGTLAWGMVGIVAIACEIPKKSFHITIGVVLGGVATTALNFVLIPSYKLTGAAAASMVGNIVALIYIFLIGQSYFFVKYELSKISKSIIVAGSIILVNEIVDGSFINWSSKLLFFKLALFVICGLALLLLGNNEVREIRSSLARSRPLSKN